ncbi:hypothetical protein V3C33_14855 [Micrococcaceae bacterium Sec5.7]
MKKKILASLTGSVILLSTLGALPAQAQDQHPLESTLESNAAVSGSAGTDRDLLANAVDPSAIVETEDSITISSEEGDVTLPDSATVPTTVESTEGTVLIGVPFADSASAPETLRPGAVAYENGNQTSTVRTIKNDGTVQTASIIESAASPERFDYPLTLPAGQLLRSLKAGF